MAGVTVGGRLRRRRYTENGISEVKTVCLPNNQGFDVVVRNSRTTDEATLARLCRNPNGC